MGAESHGGLLPCELGNGSTRRVPGPPNFCIAPISGVIVLCLCVCVCVCVVVVSFLWDVSFEIWVGMFWDFVGGLRFCWGCCFLFGLRVQGLERGSASSPCEALRVARKVSRYIGRPE